MWINIEANGQAASTSAVFTPVCQREITLGLTSPAASEPATLLKRAQCEFAVTPEPLHEQCVFRLEEMNCQQTTQDSKLPPASSAASKIRTE